MTDLVHIKTIAQFHEANGLPKPEHPLIGLIDYSKLYKTQMLNHFTHDFFSITLKRNVVGKFRYGQMDYDFDEGLMTFIAPKQVLQITIDDEQLKKKPSGWILNIHPDFFWNTVLAEKIRKYKFFEYSVNEALFLSEKEEKIILDIFTNIKSEYLSYTDEFSKNIIISQIELLLSYAERFYKRQFITREKDNHDILTKFENCLNNYFTQNKHETDGKPSVQYFANELSLSPDYLSHVIKLATGENCRQHIQNKIIEIAKEKLSTSNSSVSEIAFQLGFEHSQSFSKLFKKQTKLTPLEFRANFN